MRYRLKDNGRHLIPIREIESQILSDDPKAVRVFRNFLLNALTSGKVKPRNEYGFEVELGLLSQVTEDAIEKFAENIVREAKPRSITDFGIDPTKAKKFAREYLDKDAKLNAKEFVLMGYLTKEDVTSFLAGHGIACEWISSDGTRKQSASNVQPEIIVRKKEIMVHELQGIWANIENDLNNADRNGLKARAKLPDHGLWNMAEAICWAIERRTIIDKSKAQQIVINEPASELSVLLALLLK